MSVAAEVRAPPYVTAAPVTTMLNVDPTADEFAGPVLPVAYPSVATQVPMMQLASVGPLDIEIVNVPVVAVLLLMTAPNVMQPDGNDTETPFNVAGAIVSTTESPGKAEPGEVVHGILMQFPVYVTAGLPTKNVEVAGGFTLATPE